MVAARLRPAVNARDAGAVVPFFFALPLVDGFEWSGLDAAARAAAGMRSVIVFNLVIVILVIVILVMPLS